jgi:hypothetical protein
MAAQGGACGQTETDDFLHSWTGTPTAQREEKQQRSFGKMKSEAGDGVNPFEMNTARDGTLAEEIETG